MHTVPSMIYCWTPFSKLKILQFNVVANVAKSREAYLRAGGAKSTRLACHALQEWWISRSRFSPLMFLGRTHE